MEIEFAIRHLKSK